MKSFDLHEKDERIVWLFEKRIPILASTSQLQKTGKALEVGNILEQAEKTTRSNF